MMETTVSNAKTGKIFDGLQSCPETLPVSQKCVQTSDTQNLQQDHDQLEELSLETVQVAAKTVQGSRETFTPELVERVEIALSACTLGSSREEQAIAALEASGIAELTKALAYALEILRVANRELTEDNKLVLQGKGWGSLAIAKAEAALTKIGGNQ